MRYSLTPALGPLVYESFRCEIFEIHDSFVRAENSSGAFTQKDRDTWEYTARLFLSEYRFDSILGADRFGAIFQYLQSAKNTGFAVDK